MQPRAPPRRMRRLATPVCLVTGSRPSALHLPIAEQVVGRRVKPRGYRPGRVSAEGISQPGSGPGHTACPDREAMRAARARA